MNDSKHRGCPLKERPCSKASNRFPVHLPPCFEEIPAVRRDKVRALREALDSGRWSPESKTVAERMLCEHLFDSSRF